MRQIFQESWSEFKQKITKNHDYNSASGIFNTTGTLAVSCTAQDKADNLIRVISRLWKSPSKAI